MVESSHRALVPAGKARTEIVIDRSRFIASAGPAFSVEEAREFIQSEKKEFPDASHHVPAFLIGRGAGVIAHCTDDGEPSGTAGRPALVVLQGSGLGDVVVVVTRYFGGMKLGTGGLVRAYTGAVQEVIKVLPRAEKVATLQAALVFPYTFLERIRLYAHEYGGIILEEDFGADITMSLRFRSEHFEGFQTAVKNLTRGGVEAIILDTDPNSIMPLRE
jgi:uncharacterized YigZ family protein